MGGGELPCGVAFSVVWDEGKALGERIEWSIEDSVCKDWVGGIGGGIGMVGIGKAS